MKAALRRSGLHTVCESARCPNLGECFSKSRLTFMIMGDNCTRSCRFCAVGSEKPLPLDPGEPRRIGGFCARLRVDQAYEPLHVVITSVTRDDLPDGGAEHFTRTVGEVKRQNPKAVIELLTPDFGGKYEALDRIAQAGPDIWGHNLETVPELYHKVRPGADYRRSLKLLAEVKERRPSVLTKSALMLGLGETAPQVHKVMKDLRDVDCDLLVLGQYLQPTKTHLPVAEYLTPQIFADYQRRAYSLGFKRVTSAPHARSSYYE